MPLLTDWANLQYGDVERLASLDGLDLKDMSLSLCGIVTSTDHNALETLLELVFSVDSKRSDFIPAATQRLQTLWPETKTDQQTAASDRLLSLMFNDQANKAERSRTGRQLFESLYLSTGVLVHLVDGIQISMDTAREQLHPNKRRRTNENHSVTPLSAARLSDLRKLTLILELVDNSNPERRPELLSGLFHVLAALHQFKSQDHSELSYLLSLTLGSLLGIIREAAPDHSEVDLSPVRLDVIIDCMRVTTSSQVQNNALLLIAGITSLDPQRVLDSIMPVFTFMGRKVLSKDDEYSNYVVDQTMDKVLPALVESLRTRGEDLIPETSRLISTFTAAYEHIPSHRRLRLFRRLISNLGDETFL
ncbi:hypothetical protein HC762_00465, partial [bacterium]|nr:hypothetical protein [bacterium]